jgi:hypothetical protein
MKKYVWLFLLTAVIFSCEGEQGTQGPPGPAGPTMPVIQSLSVSGVPAEPGEEVTATVIAQSAEDLELTYTWTASAGWTITSGGDTSTVTIMSPSGYGASGSATVTVTDSQGRYAVGTIALSTLGNRAPSIQSISIYPQPVYTAANLVCSADDPDGDFLSYFWEVGGIADILTGSSAIWYSPGIPGYYEVNVEVIDDFGGVAAGSSYMNIGSGSPWPKYRRDIQSTGLSPVYTNSTTGREKWSFPTGANVYSSPAIGADGTIYVGSYDNKLYAINSDGTEKWSFTTEGDVRSSPAIGADGTIYVGSYDNKLYAINPDGSEKWSFTTGGDVFSSPAIGGADGTIYVG